MAVFDCFKTKATLKLHLINSKKVHAQEIWSKTTNKQKRSVFCFSMAPQSHAPYEANQTQGTRCKTRDYESSMCECFVKKRLCALSFLLSGSLIFHFESWVWATWLQRFVDFWFVCFLSLPFSQFSHSFIISTPLCDFYYYYYYNCWKKKKKIQFNELHQSKLQGAKRKLASNNMHGCLRIR